jgi:hypothetical protein
VAVEASLGVGVFEHDSLKGERPWFTMGDQGKRAEMGVTTASTLENDRARRESSACVFVPFGAAGELAKDKLAPALRLGRGRVSKNFAVIGVSVDNFCSVLLR